jgi:hypothetical protein
MAIPPEALKEKSRSVYPTIDPILIKRGQRTMVNPKKPAAKKISKPAAKKSTGSPKSPEKWIRTTVMIREANHGKIKAITYWEKKGIKEVVDEALKSHLKGKKVKPLPKKK